MIYGPPSDTLVAGLEHKRIVGGSAERWELHLRPRGNAR